MAGRNNNVTILAGRIGHGRPWAADSSARNVAAAQLADLILDLERLSPRLDWSPWQWSIVSTSCQMRICILRNTLREVVLSSPAGEQSAIHWVLEVDGARREIERCSDELTVQFQILQCSDPGFGRCKRDFEMFLAARHELVGVLGLARNLIGQRISPSREVAAVSACSDLVRTLRAFDEQLRAMVETYEEIPRALDEALADSAENLVSPEEVLVKLHHKMRTAVFVEHSPLRTNPNLWDAFMQQRDEFISFYRSAHRALEIYAEILQAYSICRLADRTLLQHSDLEEVRQNKSVQVQERDNCIEAIGHLSGKFSAMLTVL